MKFLMTIEVDVDFDTDGEGAVEFNIPACKDAIESAVEDAFYNNATDAFLVEDLTDASGWAVKSLNISEPKVIGVV